MEPIDVDAFEALVADALDAIPDQLRAEMENVAIIIDDESPPGRLYGLYEGIPLTQRGTYAGARPDRITLFLATICRSARTPDELARRVRVTLLHEVGPSLRSRRGASARARLGLMRPARWLPPDARPTMPWGGSSLFGGRAGVATGGVEPLVLARRPGSRCATSRAAPRPRP